MAPKKLLLSVVCALLGMSAIPCWSASIQDVANKISAGQGKVRQVVVGKRGQIFVFEESHNSRVGQIEIAHMLVRLYKQYGLQAVGLEGAFLSDSPVKPLWGTSMDDSGRLRVAARLLSEGEISSAEFIATAFPDIKVKGIDDQNQYKTDMGDRAAGAGTMYLVKIAERSVKPDQIARVNELVKGKKVDEAINLVIESDPWTKQKRAQMSQKCPNITSAEDMVRLLGEIESEAKTRNIGIDSETSEGMQKLKKFFQVTSERNAPMAQETIALTKSKPENPVAMIIGAAHTSGVAKLLRESGYSFAIIAPLALVDCNEADNLEWNAYVRKTQGKSVDNSGLGSILDGRKKPQPVINQPWMHSKANAYYALSMIARAAARGETPPFGSLSSLDKLEGIRIDKNTYRVENSEVIFQASIKDENGQWQPVWFRVGCEAVGCNGKVLLNESPKSIERRIDELIAEAGGGGGKDGPPRNGVKTLAPEDPEEKRKSENKKDKEKEEGAKKAREGAIEIDPGIYVIMSKNRSAVEKPVMLGAS